MSQMETTGTESYITRQGVKKASKHEVSNSYGMKHYYRYYKKNSSFLERVSCKEYSDIVNLMNSKIADELVENGDVVFPSSMGGLYIRVSESKLRIENGKVRGRAVNWSSTISLWLKDPEAMKNKTLVRSESRIMAKISYRRLRANFPNRMLYSLKVYRHIRNRVYNRIDQGHKYIFKDHSYERSI